MNKNDKEMQLKANYIISKAPEDIMASIYCEMKEISIVENHARVLNLIKNKDPEVEAFIAERIVGYKGEFKDRVKYWEGHNLVPLVARNALAQTLAAEAPGVSFIPNFIAMGTSATPVTENDTQLGSEFVRDGFSNRYSLDNIAYLDKFFSSPQVAGNTFFEIGVFIDGTATADSGILLSKINIEEEVLATETLTVNVSITVL